MHIYQTKVKMHDTDAAGLLFFANQFKFAHDAYETFMESLGLPFAELVKDKEYFLPIVHCEADYKSPLFVGDLIEIQVSVANIGKTSLIVEYTILDASQKIVGTAQTVHVAIDKSSRKKIPLPAELKNKLEEFRA